jgi:hypothetical protein
MLSIETLTQILTALALLFGATQFYLQRKWQTRQIAADRLKALSSNTDFMNMVRVLGWDGYYTDMYPELETGPGRFVAVTHADVRALILAELDTPPTPSVEHLPARDRQRIMVMLDVLLTELDHVARQQHSGMFKLIDVRTHLGYVLEQLKKASSLDAPNGDAEAKFLFAIWRYAKKWKYKEIVKMVERYVPESDLA